MKSSEPKYNTKHLFLDLELQGRKGETVQLKDADPNELRLFFDKMLATIKGKSVKYGF